MCREDGGQPSNKRCWKKFDSNQASWAGFPIGLSRDSSLYNRGWPSRALTANCIYMCSTGVEAPEQIDRGGSHGGIWRIILARLIGSPIIVGQTGIHFTL